MRIYRLNEADEKKARFINNHSNLNNEQKEKIIDLYIKQYIPDDIIDQNKIDSYSYDDLYNIVDTFIKNREEKRNKKNLSRAIEGRDYIKLFEDKNSEGTEYLYLSLTWIGSKYLASDHFLPKIKVPSKTMNASDFSDNSAKNEELSPGAKQCISLWTIPDLVVRNEAKSIAYCWDSANLEYIAIRVFRCPDLDHLNHESGYEMDWSKEEDRIELFKLVSTCIQTEEDPRESCKYCEASEECQAYEKYLGSKKK